MVLLCSTLSASQLGVPKTHGQLPVLCYLWLLSDSGLLSSVAIAVLFFFNKKFLSNTVTIEPGSANEIIADFDMWS